MVGRIRTMIVVGMLRRDPRRVSEVSLGRFLQGWTKRGYVWQLVLPKYRREELGGMLDSNIVLFRMEYMIIQP